MLWLRECRLLPPRKWFHVNVRRAMAGLASPGLASPALGLRAQVSVVVGLGFLLLILSWSSSPCGPGVDISRTASAAEMAVPLAALGAAVAPVTSSQVFVMCSWIRSAALAPAGAPTMLQKSAADSGGRMTLSPLGRPNVVAPGGRGGVGQREEEASIHCPRGHLHHSNNRRLMCCHSHSRGVPPNLRGFGQRPRRRTRRSWPASSGWEAGKPPACPSGSRAAGVMRGPALPWPCRRLVRQGGGWEWD